jgi:hypothetical protein
MADTVPFVKNNVSLSRLSSAGMGFHEATMLPGTGSRLVAIRPDLRLLPRTSFEAGW